MRTHTLRAELVLPKRLEEVFPFFADANNLETLTPKLLRFRVLTPSPIEMKSGLLIDYSLRLRGVPVRWQSRIAVWDPPRRFIDEQVRGPYKLWHHEHLFEPCPAGTRVIDIVNYRVPLDWLVHRALVAPDLRRIFAFRQDKMQQIFGSVGNSLGTISIE